MVIMAETKAESKDEVKVERTDAKAESRPEQRPTNFQGYLAEIVDVDMKKKTGMYGEVYLVSCKILEGKDKDRIIRRNMVGPAKPGDIIRLPDTSREAREIRVR